MMYTRSGSKILTNSHHFNGLYSTAAATSLGVLEGAKFARSLEYLRDRGQDAGCHERFISGLQQLVRFRTLHPGAYEVACEEHGRAYIELFEKRCQTFLMEHGIDGNHKDSEFANAVITNSTCIVRSQVDADSCPVEFEDEDTDKAYRNFTESATVDASIILGSSYHRSYDEIHLQTVMYGIEFMDKYLLSRFSTSFSGTAHLRFLRELIRAGSDPFQMDRHIIKKMEANPLLLMNHDEIIQAVQFGIPLEFAMAAL